MAQQGWTLDRPAKQRAQLLGHGAWKNLRGPSFVACATPALAGMRNRALVHEQERSGAAWTNGMEPPAMVISSAAAARAGELLAGIRLPRRGGLSYASRAAPPPHRGRCTGGAKVFRKTFAKSLRKAFAPRLKAIGPVRPPQSEFGCRNCAARRGAVSGLRRKRRAL